MVEPAGAEETAEATLAPGFKVWVHDCARASDGVNAMPPIITMASRSIGQGQRRLTQVIVIPYLLRLL